MIRNRHNRIPNSVQDTKRERNINTMGGSTYEKTQAENQIYYEVQKENFVRGSLFGITRLCRVKLNSDPKGRIFLSAPNNYDKFFFLHTFWSPVFDFNVEVTINESRYFTLTSAILKFAVVTSPPNILTTELRDLLYSQCIDNTCCFSFFIYPTSRIRVCKNLSGV